MLMQLAKARDPNIWYQFVTTSKLDALFLLSLRQVHFSSFFFEFYEPRKWDPAFTNMIPLLIIAPILNQNPGFSNLQI